MLDDQEFDRGFRSICEQAAIYARLIGLLTVFGGSARAAAKAGHGPWRAGREWADLRSSRRTKSARPSSAAIRAGKRLPNRPQLQRQPSNNFPANGMTIIKSSLARSIFLFGEPPAFFEPFRHIECAESPINAPLLAFEANLSSALQVANVPFQLTQAAVLEQRINQLTIAEKIRCLTKVRLEKSPKRTPTKWRAR